MKKWFKNFVKDLFNWKEWLNALFFALVVAGIIRSFFFEPYRIPSGSMLPTLQIGDYVFINKMTYGYSKYSFPFPFPFDGRINFTAPTPGDMIVFRGPKNDGLIYVKRLIGVPGDKIQMIKGVLHINKKPVKLEKLSEKIHSEPLGGLEMLTELKETLPNNVSYVIYDSNVNFHLDYPDQTEIYEVPQGHYFMMGDNRNHSADSRYPDVIGFVPEEHLLGKVIYRFWSKDLSLKKAILEFDTGSSFRFIG